MKSDFSEECKENEFLILGTSKGQTVFLDFKNISLIYTRVSITASAIKNANILSNSSCITLNEQNVMHVWSVNSGKLELFHEIKIGSNIMTFDILQDRIFLVYNSGDQELLQWNNEENKLYVVQFVKEYDHEKHINCIDSLNKHIVTCADDGLVKIWDYHRYLIKQVKFPYKLDFCGFLNSNGDIAISYQNSISVIRGNMYLSPKNEKNDNEIEEFLSKITGDDLNKEFLKATEVASHLLEEKKDRDLNKKITRDYNIASEHEKLLELELQAKKELKAKKMNEVEKLLKLSLKGEAPKSPYFYKFVENQKV